MNDDLPPHTRFTVSRNALAKMVGEEMVILDLDSSTYFGLSPVGARIWQLMGEGQSLDAICAALSEEYDVAAGQALEDARRLAGDLLGRRLISIRE